MFCYILNSCEVKTTFIIKLANRTKANNLIKLNCAVIYINVIICGNVNQH